MAKVPGTKKIVKFSKEIRGSFGRFKTEHSYSLYYLTTSIPSSETSLLSTASELFKTDKTDFEELIQRDIDYSRVRNIANKYLSQGKDRVIFFPPLLASLVLLDNEGNIQKQYLTYEELFHTDEEIGETLRGTWDHDGFQLDLPEADEDSSERKILWNGVEKHYYDFAAMLRINPRRAKLVVLDGQHRLEAIRLIQKNEDQKPILSDIEIPICIVWPPDAVKRDGSNELMTQDFRELFVRINSEPKRVSGHFIALLKDDSYSAMATRRLADLFKSINFPGSWNRLHLLEWNTREDERVEVRTRDFSVTTISIVARALSEHLFSQGLASELLFLDERSEEFQAVDPEFSWDGVLDRTQKTKIDDILKNQIDTYLVKALEILFRKPSPYQKLETALNSAFEKLNNKVNENNSSFIGLKKTLDSYIYKEDEIFEESTKSAYSDFKSWIAYDQKDRIYFLAVFQQALIRHFLNIAAVAITYDIRLPDVAEAAILSLEELALVSKDRFLGSERKYTRRMLWRNENVNFGSIWAKQAWLDILGSTLLHKQSRSALVKSLKDSQHLDQHQANELDEKLIEMGIKHAGAYSARLLDELKKETKQTLDDFFPEDKANQLRILKETNKKEFNAQINKKAEARHFDAITELSDQLGVKTEELLNGTDNS